MWKWFWIVDFMYSSWWLCVLFSLRVWCVIYVMWHFQLMWYIFMPNLQRRLRTTYTSSTSEIRCFACWYRWLQQIYCKNSKKPVCKILIKLLLLANGKYIISVVYKILLLNTYLFSQLLLMHQCAKLDSTRHLSSMSTTESFPIYLFMLLQLNLAVHLPYMLKFSKMPGAYCVRSNSD